MARRKSDHRRSNERHELATLALRGCLVACDAVYNVLDLLANSSRMAFLAVRDCEKELDRLEREMDEQLPRAITQVNELQARELLACLRFSMELERIGDLLWGVGQRLQSLRTPLPKADSQQLTAMLDILSEMLNHVRQGFEERELNSVNYVLRADREIDRIYKGLFRRHLKAEDEDRMPTNPDVLLMAQAFERSGDHATNLAEELFRLMQGHSLRHVAKKQLKD